MSHLTRDASKLLARIRRLKGQAEAAERAIEAGTGCAEILMLVASMRGAINGLTVELMEDHLREHVLNASDGAARAKGADELNGILRTYLK